MALNDVMARLAAGIAPPAAAPKPEPEPQQKPAPESAPPDYRETDAAQWETYRQIWKLAKCLKCSRCTEAIEGRCKRGDLRKERKRNGLRCFNPNPRQLAETREIVSIVKNQQQ